jgi:hypothetical protein
MQGIHLAYRVSISVSSNGSFRCTVWERKLVSMRMLGWVSLGGERGERIGEGRYLLVGRHESSVVLEEERGGYLRSVMVSVYPWRVSGRGAGELGEMGENAYTSRTTSLPLSAFLAPSSPLFWFFFSRASFCPMIRLTWPC